MLNNQPIEKKSSRTDGQLEVHSIFKTIQGEGPFCGVPAVFIRLAGCNLQCRSCDTDYTSTRQAMYPSDILKEVKSFGNGYDIGEGLVVITGGEPFRQDLGDLFYCLIKEGFYVQVETNGTFDPPRSFEYTTNAFIPEGSRDGKIFLVCSPKTGAIRARIADVACALKYVVSAGDVCAVDGLPTKVLGGPCERVSRAKLSNFDFLNDIDLGYRPIYIQPADEKDPVKNAANLEAAIQACMQYRGRVLQLQTHKIIDLE